MFILPVHAHTSSFSLPFSWPQPQFNGVFPHWQWLLLPLRLGLTLLATLLVFVLVRRLLVSRFGVKKAAPIAVPAVEKPSPSSLEGGEKRSSWLPSLNVNVNVNVNHGITTLAESLPITLNGPPAPPIRGRHVYRGGRGVGFNVSTRRPEAALATKQRVEAPLPAIYEPETPVSMAKMIMSRHTYRAPSPHAPRRSPAAPAPSSPRVHAFRPPSPEEEGHGRSASV
ncbi:hypothetical protein C8R45DRAFT_421928 [Mycena sanguinolenta]|nr:hypothetical protein C8R45DRAFT_421928 [Mycena sanguinolenta]